MAINLNNIVTEAINVKFRYPNSYFKDGIMTSFVHSLIETSDDDDVTSDIYKQETINYIRDIIKTKANDTTDLFFNLVSNTRDFVSGQLNYKLGQNLNIAVNNGLNDNKEIGRGSNIEVIVQGNVLRDRSKFRLYALSDLNIKDNDPLGIINTTLYQEGAGSKYNASTDTTILFLEAIDA
tara:strand:+ start:92 stop:631 length:540 start_codon:yes stop_codon:yes gene_type:complete